MKNLGVLNAVRLKSDQNGVVVDVEIPYEVTAYDPVNHQIVAGNIKQHIIRFFDKIEDRPSTRGCINKEIELIPGKLWCIAQEDGIWNLIGGEHEVRK